MAGVKFVTCEEHHSLSARNDGRAKNIETSGACFFDSPRISVLAHRPAGDSEDPNVILCNGLAPLQPAARSAQSPPDFQRKKECQGLCQDLNAVNLLVVAPV